VATPGLSQQACGRAQCARVLRPLPCVPGQLQGRGMILVPAVTSAALCCNLALLCCWLAAHTLNHPMHACSALLVTDGPHDKGCRPPRYTATSCNSIRFDSDVCGDAAGVTARITACIARHCCVMPGRTHGTCMCGARAKAHGTCACAAETVTQQSARAALAVCMHCACIAQPARVRCPPATSPMRSTTAPCMQGFMHADLADILQVHSDPAALLDSLQAQRDARGNAST
jgi:hypothetical protein